MSVSEQDFEIFFQDYQDLANALLSANYSTFTDKLKRFLKFLGESQLAKPVLDSQLPVVEFEEWYRESCTTVKSIAGSGTLIWPSVSTEHTAMTLALLNYIGLEKEDVPAFCRKFMYSGNDFNTLVDDFNDQIVEPFCQDMFKLIQRNTVVEDTLPTNMTSHISWHQKPIGQIGIGLFVAIVSGMFLAKFTGLV